jgi:hypothetical protein
MFNLIRIRDKDRCYDKYSGNILLCKDLNYFINSISYEDKIQK